MNEWILNIAGLLAGAFVGRMLWVTMNSYRVDASCRCGKVQIHGPVASSDVAGLVERLERSCPECNQLYHSIPQFKKQVITNPENMRPIMEARS